MKILKESRLRPPYRLFTVDLNRHIYVKISSNGMVTIVAYGAFHEFVITHILEREDC